MHNTPPPFRLFNGPFDLNPSSVTAHLYLATAYMQQYIPGVESNENSQVAARAKEAFSQVLVFDPTNKVALASMASLYLNEKKWDDAQQWYEKLIAADPRDANAYYSLGFTVWSKWFPAYQEARARVGLKPDDQGPIPDVAVKQDLRGRWGSVVEDGIANLQKALDLNPRYDDAMSYISLLIRERGDLRDTKEEWRQDIALADQWLQKRQTNKAGGGIGFSPQAATQTANSYSLEGLPQYGLNLSGSPEDPIIENHSGRVIIGYNIETADANGNQMTSIGQIIAPSVLPAGLPDGKSLYAMGNFPVDASLQRAGRVQVRGAPGRGPAVRATLTSVVFGDGQFVGLDERGIFERFGKELKGVQEAGVLAKTGAWDQLDALNQAFRQMQRQPPPEEDRTLYSFRQLAAQRLVETRRTQGRCCGRPTGRDL
jgi:tetratricopeptide (TPR) repeat protein